MTVREAEALQYICTDLPENPVIIQIGAERGASTLAMLDESPDAFIFSVDIGERPEERENLIRAGQEWHRVVRGLGRSQIIGEYWPKEWKADLVLIDGDHRRPGIDEDLLVWPPVVRDGGYLALHDYIHPDQRGPQIQGRVWEAVEEWRSLCPEFEEVLCQDRLLVFQRNCP